MEGRIEGRKEEKLNTEKKDWKKLAGLLNGYL